MIIDHHLPIGRLFIWPLVAVSADLQNDFLSIVHQAVVSCLCFWTVAPRAQICWIFLNEEFLELRLEAVQDQYQIEVPKSKVILIINLVKQIIVEEKKKKTLCFLFLQYFF